MPTYKTKPIDFTGCHPIIAEHLKRGEAIFCHCWDDDPREMERHFIIGYASEDLEGFYYLSDSGDDIFKHAQPIEQKLYWKKASEIVKWLEEREEGFELDCDDEFMVNGEYYGPSVLNNAGIEASDWALKNYPSEWFESR